MVFRQANNVMKITGGQNDQAIGLTLFSQPLRRSPHATKVRNVVGGVALGEMSRKPGFKALLPV